ncbi:hypothetical protein JW905_17090 [bacterium]|nr:hypothetical protein [candidate division CSSED10-310 bacterium]
MDLEIEAPEGLQTATQSTLGERIAGLLHRWWPVPVELHVFLRWFVRILAVLEALAVFLIARELSFAKTSSACAAFVYATALPAVTRSMGDVFYHEHTALLFFSFHLALLMRYLNGRGSYLQVPASLLMLAALLCWKVMLFAFAVEMGMLSLIWVVKGARRELEVGILWTAGIPAACALLPGNYLHWDGFLTSPGVLLAGLLVLCMGLQRLGWTGKTMQVPLTRLSATAVLVALVIVVHLAVGSTGTYGHVWSTILYRLYYLKKPADPDMLPFEARHYWVPPYTSPSLFELFDEYIPYLLLAAGSLLLWLRRRTRGAGVPIMGAGAMFAATGSISFLLLFFLFVKLKTFMVLFSAPFTAGLFTRRRSIMPWAAAFLIAIQVYQAVVWNNSALTGILYDLGLDYGSDRRAGNVTTGEAVSQMLYWIAANTKPDEVIAAEFTLSPVILAYTGRRTCMHAYFESTQRDRFRQFCEALFDSEDALAGVLRQWHTEYLVYSAHMLFRTDSNLSFRYVAAAMTFSREWPVYTMHFHPERLRFLQQVAVNDFFKVFRVLPAGEKNPGPLPSKYHTLFDERLVMGDLPGDPDGRPDTSAWLPPMVAGFDCLTKAKIALAEKRYHQAEISLRRSLKATDLIAETHTLLAYILLRDGEVLEARSHLQTALQLDPDDSRATRLMSEGSATFSP